MSFYKVINHIKSYYSKRYEKPNLSDHLSTIFDSFHSSYNRSKQQFRLCGIGEFFDFVDKIDDNFGINTSEDVSLSMMNNIQEDKENKYRKKYKYMKIRIKSLILENAALCDEVARIQESILIVKEERKFLLRKLLEYEHEADNVSQTYYRNDAAVVLNGPRAKLKKRRSLEDGGKTSSAPNI